MQLCSLRRIEQTLFSLVLADSFRIALHSLSHTLVCVKQAVQRVAAALRADCSHQGGARRGLAGREAAPSEYSGTESWEVCLDRAWHLPAPSLMGPRSRRIACLGISEGRRGSQSVVLSSPRRCCRSLWRESAFVDGAANHQVIPSPIWRPVSRSIITEVLWTSLLLFVSFVFFLDPEYGGEGYVLEFVCLSCHEYTTGAPVLSDRSLYTYP